MRDIESEVKDFNPAGFDMRKNLAFTSVSAYLEGIDYDPTSLKHYSEIAEGFISAVLGNLRGPWEGVSEESVPNLRGILKVNNRNYRNLSERDVRESIAYFESMLDFLQKIGNPETPLSSEESKDLAKFSNAMADYFAGDIRIFECSPSVLRYED